jgi:SAM-dependent methyltransferase
VGIDFSSAQVDYARQRHPEIEYVQGNAEALPFPDESQDVVVINFAIHHFANPDAALASAFRVLRSGGQIGFTTWRPVPETTGFRIVHEAVEAHGICEPGGPWEPDFFRFSDPQVCEHRLVRAGFEEPKAKTISLVWQLPSADSLYGAMVKGTTRFAALLEAQSPDATAFIRRDMQNAAQAFEDQDGVHLPMPANLVVARKP